MMKIDWRSDLIPQGQIVRWLLWLGGLVAWSAFCFILSNRLLTHTGRYAYSSYFFFQLGVWCAGIWALEWLVKPGVRGRSD